MIFPHHFTSDIALADLLDRSAEGDSSAFASLHAATSAWFHAICAQFPGDKADVEDAVQNIYVSLWTGAWRFDHSRDECLGWLGTIARNRAIDGYRRSRASGAMLPLDAIEFVDDEGASPFEFADHAIRCERLHAQLRRLDRRSRRLIRQSFFASLTHAQIAARESLPLGSVKSIIRKGLLQLQARLACSVS